MQDEEQGMLNGKIHITEENVGNFTPADKKQCTTKKKFCIAAVAVGAVVAVGAGYLAWLFMACFSCYW